jgi:ketosteroid isomerase-like protein
VNSKAGIFAFRFISWQGFNGRKIGRLISLCFRFNARLYICRKSPDMKKSLATAFFLCGLFTISFGQKKLTEHTFEYDGTTKVPATVNDLDWLTGRWSGEGFGGWLEEIWSPPAGAQMLATFRMLENGKPVFSEICQIAEENGTLTYKVKHFNPDLTGWEEKNEYVTFNLIKIEPNAVYFNGLTMALAGDKCNIWLAMKQKDGSFQEEHLVYQRDLGQRVLPQIHIPQDAEHLAQLKEIDRDIWTPFAEAFATNNADKYLALHTPDFIRANGGEWAGVKDLDAYGEHVRENFQNGRNAEIAFTFFERAAGKGMATERGIYRYTAISPSGDRQHYYGKFHVILRKMGSTWKIAVDYDSDEDGRVGEADFMAGLPPGVFAK